MMTHFTAGKLTVEVYSNGKEMGEAAALAVTECIKELLSKKDTVNIIFAAAPSQNEFLAALIKQEGIKWRQVQAFHMDEYTGLPATAAQAFGNFLRVHIFDQVPLQEVHYIDGNAENLSAECVRYGNLLKRFPPDIVCMGIGENGHLAFNDPPVADFRDTAPVKLVTLDEACRRQQVNDGCFENIDAVPKQALTLTIPALMQTPFVFCMVPGSKKADAVYNTIHRDIREQYPSTILRTHGQAIVYLDKDSSSMLASTI